MDELNDLTTYNGDTEHDMWVDYDNYEHIGSPDVFNESDIDNLNDLD